MSKGHLSLTQALYVAAALLVWTVSHPTAQEYVRALRGFLTNPPIQSAYFYAGSANTSCVRVTDPKLDRLTHCEDAKLWPTVDPKTGRTQNKVVAACDPGRKAWNPIMGPLVDPLGNGAFWVYDFMNKRVPEKIVLQRFPLGHVFHPLGFELVPATATTPTYLFATNHDISQNTVEQFSLNDKAPYRATWIRTLSHPFLRSPNAIFAINSTSLYVSNDHSFTHRGATGALLPTFEDLLQLPLGWLSHVDLSGDEIVVKRVANGINFANGVSVTKDGKELAIASTISAIVHIYDRNSDTNELTWRLNIPMPFGPDNLGYEPDGSLTVAGHPHGLGIVGVGAGLDETSPSWVISVAPRVRSSMPSTKDVAAQYPAYERLPPVATHEITTLYQSDGIQFGGSAKGLRDGDHLFVVPLFGRGILHCKP